MAPKTMKAAVCKEAGQRLVIVELPVPTPQGRQLLVRVKAASLCQSDMSILKGDIGAIYPLIPGHEAVSVVEEIGPDAASYGICVGDLVGASSYDNMCMTCTSCQHYGPEYCSKIQILGITKPGYFAEYTLIDAANTIVIARDGEDSLASPAELAPLFCAGITVWDALERAKPNANETFAIIGAGGLGAIAVRYLHSFGVKVLALDVRDAQLQTLQDAGIVDGVLNTNDLTTEKLTEKVLSLNNGLLVDSVIVTSGAVPAYLNAFPILKPGGKLVVVGLPHDAIPLQALAICGRNLSILGAKIPGRIGAQRGIDYTLRKKLFPKIHPRHFKLEDINEMIDVMKANRIEEGRMVVQFD